MTLNSYLSKNCYRKGFTLIELMIALAIIAILAALAAPGFNNLIAKNRVRGATEEIYGLLLQASSEGGVRDTNMAVSIDTDAWCVGFSTSTCDCTGSGSCVLDVAGTEVEQVVGGVEFPDVSIAENFSGVGPAFNRLRGSANSGTINVINGDWQLNIVVSAQGRIRICNPNDNVISGYDQC